MTNWKKYILAAVIVAAAVFAFNRNLYRSVPSDFRDAPRDTFAVDSLKNSTPPGGAGETSIPEAPNAPQAYAGENDSPVVPPNNASEEDGISPKWYGADSNRARMKFTTYVLSNNYSGESIEEILTEKITSQIVDLQLKHMFGAFKTQPDFKNNPGIPSGTYKVKLLGAERVSGTPYIKIRYSYDDLVVFSKNLFRGGNQSLSFVLPKDPLRIYKKGHISGTNRNHCTDKHHNHHSDFWYFWDPYQEGCPITDTDLVTVQAELQPISSTLNTYPEYRQLRDGNLMQVTFLIGVNENFNYNDAGTNNFRDAFVSLQKAGFKAILDKPRHKMLSLRNAKYTTHLNIYLVKSDTVEFAQLAVNGLENSDIFLYNGHSGLGSYLDPKKLAEAVGKETLSLPTRKYQILYFNGCSTYAYYNVPFFELKRTPDDPNGTKKLDIITTGIASMFLTGAEVDVSFLTSIATDQRPSWQTIINRIHKAEGDYSALTHVNGDEDNPTTP